MIDAGREYEIYLGVRDAVLRMKQHGNVAAPSRYWIDELSNIDYMFEASPSIIRKLRHHAFHVTGIRPFNYRDQNGEARDAFDERLKALVALGGQDLVVPEHEALGGFGYQLSAGLFNLDTIKFLEVLVGMRRAAVLPALDAGRGVVLEIGAGWGGFAYQVKTLYPRVTYVIVDLPELFLFSATYLQAVFPDARVVFVDGQVDAEKWKDADFVFVPNTMADQVRECSPTVTVNIASFQEMTTTQVETYARLAAEAGSRFMYSLNRERSGHNAELDAVSKLLGPYFDLREIDVLDTDYTNATKRMRGPSRAGTDPDRGHAYRHLAGARRPEIVPRLVTDSADGAPVAIGATLYNRAAYLRESLDSILAQTHRDFRLVLVDDASEDDSETIGREYAARDARVTYIRHRTRQGMTATWRHAFEAATADRRVRYFAWASDHDRWHPRWLGTLLAELDANPRLAIAYPHTRRIDPDGRLLDKPSRLFETAGMSDLDERWPFVCRETVASGDMVYGLMRVDAVKKAGIFRDVMCPDRLLMTELALYGEFRQVPEDLWFRREFGGASVARQRTSLFAGRAPLAQRLPPWLQHGRVLWDAYVRPVKDPAQRRAARRRVLQYTWLYALKHHQKTTTYRQFGSVLRGLTWTRKRIKHYALLGIFHTLVSSRRAYHRTVYEVAIFTRRIGLR